jgi:hypothetical protein
MVEVVGRWSNLSEQGERLQVLVEMVPSGLVEPIVRTKKRISRRLRQPEIEELVAGYKAGASVYELGRHFQIHRDTVASILERQNVPRRGRPLTPAQIDEAVKLYGEGLSLAKIAPKLGCHPSTVRLALLEAGVRLRDNHGQPSN